MDQVGRGVNGFVADLAAEEIEAIVDGGVVVYALAPVHGRLAGTTLLTGVSADELVNWPLTPPHWIHLPETVTFESTNPDYNGALPGWVRHSRDIGSWDLSRRPILSWLAHVRGVLGTAA